MLALWQRAAGTGVETRPAWRRSTCAALESAAAAIPVLWAIQLVGVAVLDELVERAARALPGWDYDIVESHRILKDAPSGTALTLGEISPARRGAGALCRHRRRRHRRRYVIQFAGQGASNWSIAPPAATSSPVAREHAIPAGQDRELGPAYDARTAVRPGLNGRLSYSATRGGVSFAAFAGTILARLLPPPRTGEKPSPRFLAARLRRARRDRAPHTRANDVTQPAILVLEDGTVFEANP